VQTACQSSDEKLSLGRNNQPRRGQRSENFEDESSPLLSALMLDVSLVRTLMLGPSGSGRTETVGRAESERKTTWMAAPTKVERMLVRHAMAV
jgi:hypothetical protein